MWKRAPGVAAEHGAAKSPVAERKLDRSGLIVIAANQPPG